MKLAVEDFDKGKAWMRDIAPSLADKLAPIYEAAGHHWGTRDKDWHIPTGQEIHAFILSLVDSLRINDDGDFASIRSGGIEVFVGRDGTSSFEACINFSVSEHLFESASNPEY